MGIFIYLLNNRWRNGSSKEYSKKGENQIQTTLRETNKSTKALLHTTYQPNREAEIDEVKGRNLCFLPSLNRFADICTSTGAHLLRSSQKHPH